MSDSLVALVPAYLGFFVFFGFILCVPRAAFFTFFLFGGTLRLLGGTLRLLRTLTNLFAAVWAAALEDALVRVTASFSCFVVFAVCFSIVVSDVVVFPVPVPVEFGV